MTNIVRLIGDVHGKYGPYRTILKSSPYPTIQIGDMGIGFRKWPHGEWHTNPPHALMVEKKARFIRGNHDNPSVCRQHSQFIKDGSVEGSTMFVGGALSIDKAYRYPEFSWWEDEEISTRELNELVEQYEKTMPMVMITHECPESLALEVFRAGGNGTKLDPRFVSRTRQAFESMLSWYAPKLWVFGHWHTSFDYLHEGKTRFICLNELECKDVDLDEGEVV